MADEKLNVSPEENPHFDLERPHKNPCKRQTLTE